MAGSSRNLSGGLRLTIAACLAGCLLSAAIQAGTVNKVVNLQSSSNPAGSTTRDRWFLSTGFQNTTQIWDTGNLGFFKGGRLFWTQSGSSVDYGWTDPVPMDAGSGNSYPLNPDRGDQATPFAGESAPGGPYGTLREVFGTNNLAYLLDGEDNSLAWDLDLYYQDGFGVVNDGDESTMELLMFERGMNSKLGARAILEDGSMSSSLILNFTNSGYAGYQLDTLEIGGPQNVGGFGVDLNAFNLSTGAKVIGYRFFSDGTSSFNGPDLLGFVGTVKAQPLVQPVPEPGTIVLAGIGGLAMGLAGLRRRRSSRSTKPARA